MRSGDFQRLPGPPRLAPLIYVRQACCRSGGRSPGQWLHHFRRCHSPAPASSLKACFSACPSPARALRVHEAFAVHGVLRVPVVVELERLCAAECPELAEQVEVGTAAEDDNDEGGEIVVVVRPQEGHHGHVAEAEDVARGEPRFFGAVGLVEEVEVVVGQRGREAAHVGAVEEQGAVVRVLPSVKGVEVEELHAEEGKVDAGRVVEQRHGEGHEEKGPARGVEEEHPGDDGQVDDVADDDGGLTHDDEQREYTTEGAARLPEHGLEGDAEVAPVLVDARHGGAAREVGARAPGRASRGAARGAALHIPARLLQLVHELTELCLLNGPLHGHVKVGAMAAVGRERLLEAIVDRLHVCHTHHAVERGVGVPRSHALLRGECVSAHACPLRVLAVRTHCLAHVPHGHGVAHALPGLGHARGAREGRELLPELHLRGGEARAVLCHLEEQVPQLPLHVALVPQVPRHLDEPVPEHEHDDAEGEGVGRGLAVDAQARKGDLALGELVADDEKPEEAEGDIEESAIAQRVAHTAGHRERARSDHVAEEVAHEVSQEHGNPVYRVPEALEPRRHAPRRWRALVCCSP
mmetsp:Transcript_14460/g.44006  ORF Transcript_14460/g.44006 Transcript_14460/m.44006 type:complete len:581 (-) Transcript_14460:419-2161(-)